MDDIQKVLVQAGRKDLAQKYYKKIAKPTAWEEYERQSKAIKANIDMINKMWKKIEAKYKKQLKDNPKGWAGIGRGSELGALVVKTNELGTFIYQLGK